jgi:hypothetical protein
LSIAGLLNDTDIPAKNQDVQDSSPNSNISECLDVTPQLPVYLDSRILYTAHPRQFLVIRRHFPIHQLDVSLLLIYQLVLLYSLEYEFRRASLLARDGTRLPVVK